MAGNWNRIGNISGRDGKGVPEGGTKDDVLVKVGGSDFATGWSKLDYSQIAGKVPAEALPQISVEPYVVDSQEAMLNLPAVPGRMAIRTDVGKTFVLAEEPASTLANWVELKTSSDVTSVNDKVGAVVLTKADVGLSNVDNTADVDKPLATDSVRGLMSPSDRKVLYDRSSSPVKKVLGAAHGTVVEMDHFGRFTINEPYYADNPASKGYVDGKMSNALLGQASVGPTTNWNGIDTSLSAVIDADQPPGSPAYRWENNSIEFGTNKVWLLESVAPAMNYRRQRATILHCSAPFLIGFSWERTWNPATGSWNHWATVAGDTGWLDAPAPGDPIVLGKPMGVNGRFSFYGSTPVRIRRVGNTVTIKGSVTTTSGTALDELNDSRDGAVILWLSSSAGNPRAFFRLPHDGDYSNSVQVASGSNRWTAYFSGGDLRGNRYGPARPHDMSKLMLTFNMTWEVPTPWVA